MYSGNRTLVFVDEDTNFTAGETLRILDVSTTLGHNATRGYIACDGTGNLLVELAFGPSDPYSNPFTMRNGEVVTIEGLTVARIRLTHSGTDSSYRVLVA